MNNKSVYSFLHAADNVTLLASAAKHLRSGMQKWDGRTDRRTDGRTPNSFIDPAPHAMPAVSVIHAGRNAQ